MADSPNFQRVAVLGTGLIGGSFSLAVKRHLPQAHIIGVDRPEIARLALERGVVHEIVADIPSAVRAADLVYIALPIAAAIDALPTIASAAPPEALVTDSCSTKAVLCATAHKCFGGRRFLGGHPMAGKENSGIVNSDVELFRGAPYALIGSGEGLDAGVSRFVDLLEALGAKIVWCDAETHDWAVGVVSHLPQLAAIALARVVGDETDETGLPLSLAGPGLQDTLRLAGSPYAVWRDIFLTNKDNVARALDRLGQAIDHLRTQLTSKELEQEFQSANDLYKLLRKPQ